MSSTILDITPPEGLDEGEGVELSWSPVDDEGNPITGAAGSITLGVRESGTLIEKTGGDLTEDPAGTYLYVHKIGVPGPVFGFWELDGTGNADGIRQFKMSVRRVVAKT